MKLKPIIAILFIFSVVACETKIDLSKEKFDKSKFKETLEKAYADSTNKENKELLLTYINANLEGKIPNAEYFMFDIKKKLESDKTTLTYGEILNKYAIPYENWKKKIGSVIDIKLIKFKKSKGIFVTFDAELEIQNKGEIDIIEGVFGLDITNKSGEQLFSAGGFMPNKTLAKGATTKVEISSDQFERIQKLDPNSFTTTFSIRELSFQDGTKFKIPSVD
jgi:hypothetical protein